MACKIHTDCAKKKLPRFLVEILKPQNGLSADFYLKFTCVFTTQLATGKHFRINVRRCIFLKLASAHIFLKQKIYANNPFSFLLQVCCSFARIATK